MLSEAGSLLLGLGFLGPGEGQRGGEEDAGLEAPVRGVLHADRGRYGGLAAGTWALKAFQGRGGGVERFYFFNSTVKY